MCPRASPAQGRSFSSAEISRFTRSAGSSSPLRFAGLIYIWKWRQTHTWIFQQRCGSATERWLLVLTPASDWKTVSERLLQVFTAVNDLYYASVIFTVIIIITPACAIHFSISPPGPQAFALDSRTKRVNDSITQRFSLQLASAIPIPSLQSPLQSEITADDEIDTFEAEVIFWQSTWHYG